MVVYYKDNTFLSGGLWIIDKEKTDEMIDIGARVYPACVQIADKAVFCFSDFPQAQVTIVLSKNEHYTDLYIRV